MYWALLAWQPPFAASGHASVQNLTLTRSFWKMKSLKYGHGLVTKTMEANVVRRSRMALMKANVVMAVMETNMVMMETNVAMMDTNVVVGHDGGQCGQGVLWSPVWECESSPGARCVAQRGVAAHTEWFFQRLQFSATATLPPHYLPALDPGAVIGCSEHKQDTEHLYHSHPDQLLLSARGRLKVFLNFIDYFENILPSQKYFWNYLNIFNIFIRTRGRLDIRYGRTLGPPPPSQIKNFESIFELNFPGKKIFEYFFELNFPEKNVIE